MAKYNVSCARTAVTSSLLFLGVILAALPTSVVHADCLSITGITAHDRYDSFPASDDEGTGSLDVVKNNCGTEDDPQDEGFQDTLMAVTVVNQCTGSASFSRIYYRVPSPYGAGGRLRTKKFALLGQREVPNDGEPHKIYGLFLDVTGSTKAYAGKTTSIPASLGFRNVRVFVAGRLGSRNEVLSSAATLSFDDVDNCD
ncbi:MAG: hypothetical protein K1X83_11000 [Oligoflexia bacterium]|nr:hypothetical protein [Oligoflexia bacterium]